MSESQPRTRFNGFGAYGVLMSFSQDSQDRPTECPPPSKEKCDPATSIANCWSPGSEVIKSTCSQFTFMLVPRRKTFKSSSLQDVDCLNHGLCCYNGCANVCLDSPATCSNGESKTVSGKYYIMPKIVFIHICP